MLLSTVTAPYGVINAICNPQPYQILDYYQSRPDRMIQDYYGKSDPLIAMAVCELNQVSSLTFRQGKDVLLFDNFEMSSFTVAPVGQSG